MIELKAGNKTLKRNTELNIKDWYEQLKLVKEFKEEHPDSQLTFYDNDGVKHCLKMIVAYFNNDVDTETLEKECNLKQLYSTYMKINKEFEECLKLEAVEV